MQYRYFLNIFIVFGLLKNIILFSKINYNLWLIKFFFNLINHLNNIFEIYWVKSNLDKYKKSNVKVYLTDMIGIIRLSALDDEDNCINRLFFVMICMIMVDDIIYKGLNLLLINLIYIIWLVYILFDLIFEGNNENK